MQTLELNEEVKKKSKGFWRRQFQTEATRAQKTFDWLFGVLLPIACFIFDPVVFKGNLLGEAYLGAYKPFAYTLSFVSVMAMAAWLIWGAKLKWLNGWLAGFFLVGGIVSLAIGVILFPISLLGLVMMIGVLGFTPLLSGAIFLRNALRAYRMAKPLMEKNVLVYSMVLSALLTAVIPSVINAEINHSLDKIINGDAPTIRAETAKLKYFAPLINFEIFRQNSYRSRRTTEANEAVAVAYKELTGKEL